MSRLCGSVSKSLLLLHIVPSGSPLKKSTILGLKDYNVEAVQVQRWLPEEHRSATISGMSKGSAKSSCVSEKVPTSIANFSAGRSSCSCFECPAFSHIYT
eukprot:TRINITY_DN4641_c0_g1_i4.p3 TRINITY_DN4641_c0_g1~~TRINITY_DN4641_c0_g1_i4.p3  ORF type:complete len:100 (-),score=7.46 TRINITY_DN4641_c0_g1_i4:290-589(-)